jgi:hypothetical protein
MPFEKTRKCAHVKMTGRQCQAPALKRGRYCVFHSKTRQQARNIIKKYVGAMEYEIPVLEDANSVQLTLMSVMQMLAKGSIEHKTAGLMLYALQTASINLRRPEFQPVDEKEEKGQAVLDALITIGKHMHEPVPPWGWEDLDNLGKAVREADEAEHPSKEPPMKKWNEDDGAR